MTFGEVMAVIGALGSIVGAASSARWGHDKLEKQISALKATLGQYITVPEHRAAMTQIHNEKNDLKVKVARLEERDAIKDNQIAQLRGALSLALEGAAGLKK